MISITKRLCKKVTRLEGIHFDNDKYYNGHVCYPALLRHKFFASKSHTRKSDEKKLIKKDSHHHFTPKAFPIL